MSSQPNQNAVKELIRLIYEAAGDVRQWPSFLRQFAGPLKASAVGLVVHDSGNGKAQVDASFNVDPSYQNSFVQYYSSINPWTAPEAAHLWTPGRVLEGREIITEKDMLQTEFYNGFLRPQGWFSALGGAISRTDSVVGFITALRPRSVAPDRGRTLLYALMPHLQAAMRLHQRIAGLETTVSALSDVIDYLPGGVIIADAHARVLVMNRAAEAILNGNAGLTNGPHGLQASEVNESIALRGMIGRAVAAREGETPAPLPIAISRACSVRPLQVVIAPLPPQNSGTGRQPSAVLFVSDPDDSLVPNQSLMQRTFSLTEAEARVAVALTQGKSVEEIAVEFGVSHDTIRTQLKRVFSKTGTGRQGELIRLLLTQWNTIRTDAKK